MAAVETKGGNDQKWKGQKGEKMGHPPMVEILINLSPPVVGTIPTAVIGFKQWTDPQ